MRTLNAGAAALQARAVAGERIPVILLIHFDTPVPQRWAACGLPLVWGGYTWESVEVAIEAITDATDEAGGMKFTLPAATEQQLALAMQDLGGCAVTVRKAWVDPDTGTVEDAVQIWAGELDTTGWQDGPQAAAHFSAESRATVAMRPRPSRYTNDEQQRLHPGDTSLDVDPMTDAAPLVWPAAAYFRAR